MISKLLSKIEEQEVFNFYEDFNRTCEETAKLIEDLDYGYNPKDGQHDLSLLLACENSRRNNPYLANCL